MPRGNENLNGQPRFLWRTCSERLVPAGNAKYAGDRKRSLDLATLLPMLPRGPRYWCLQKEISAADAEVLRDDPRIERFEQNAFPETAAQALAMDVVLSVDTSIAQLACALGCRTWILLAAPADFRWLVGREDSPWNPTARLFRQPAPGQWRPVLERVQVGLQSLASSS